MSAVGTKLRRAVGDDGVRLMHWCPGCESPHGIRIQGEPPLWFFNQDYVNPAFEPSIRVFVTHYTDDDDKKLPHPVQETLCHYFIRLGSVIGKPGLEPNKSYIDYCADSPHKLKGQTVELVDWPYSTGSYGGIED